jgi:hypothetical protein
MRRYTVYLYLETALHVSGGTSTHHQERIQLYLQHMVELFTDINKRCILLDILTMHGPINVKSPNNISKWQMGFNSAFKGLTL